jgi:hypothetical protein
MSDDDNYSIHDGLAGLFNRRILKQFQTAAVSPSSFPPAFNAAPLQTPYPRPRDYAVEDVCRTHLIASDWSEKLWSSCPVLLDSSGGVGLVCGMKRGILKRRIALLKLVRLRPY